MGVQNKFFIVDIDYKVKQVNKNTVNCWAADSMKQAIEKRLNDIPIKYTRIRDKFKKANNYENK